MAGMLFIFSRSEMGVSMFWTEMILPLRFPLIKFFAYLAQSFNKGVVPSSLSEAVTLPSCNSEADESYHILSSKLWP